MQRKESDMRSNRLVMKEGITTYIRRGEKVPNGAIRQPGRVDGSGEYYRVGNDRITWHDNDKVIQWTWDVKLFEWTRKEIKT